MHLLDLETNVVPEIKKHLPFPIDINFPDMVKKHVAQTESPNYKPFVKDLQSFIKQQQRVNQLKVLKENVPSEILKSAALYDIQSNDRIYSNNSSIRQRIPKGLCILKMNLHNNDDDDNDDIVIYADKKYTGTNVNDDDSGDTDFSKYFLKRYCHTSYIISAPEIDGDAFHFSVRYINNKFYLIVGNQNNHMILGEKNDIQYYTKDKYKTTRIFAEALFDQMAELDDNKRELLYNFLYHTKITFLCRYIGEDTQRVIPYYNLSKIVFLTFTFHHQQQSLIPFPFFYTENIIRYFGLTTTINTDVHNGSKSILGLREYIRRKNYLTKGMVLYCQDNKDNTIGMIKIKTINYICLRELLEIYLRILKQQQKQQQQQQQQQQMLLEKLVKRKYSKILSDFNLSEDYINIWVSYGIRFINKWIKEMGYSEFQFKYSMSTPYGVNLEDEWESENIGVTKTIDPLLPESIFQKRL